jgi:tetratricopeptide (TPR) repeat protein
MEKFDLALEVINSAPKESAESPSLLSQKAFLLVSLERIDEAVTTLDHAIALYPARESFWHNKGSVLDRLGRREEAMECYKKGIALGFECPTIHYQYGVLLYDKKDFVSALGEFEKALDLRPSDSDFILWKSMTLGRLEKKSEALDIIKSLVAKDQTNADAWYVLGVLTEDFSAGLGYFQKAIQLNPKHSGALCSSAALLSNLRRYDEALDIFRSIHNVCSEHESCPTLIVNICITLRNMGRVDEAMKACEEILAKDPNNTGALSGKALCLSNSGRYDEALVIFSHLLQSAPEQSDSWYNQACTYALMNKASKAVQSLRKAIDLDPQYKSLMRMEPDFELLRKTGTFRRAFPEAIQVLRKTRRQTKPPR